MKRHVVHRTVGILRWTLLVGCILLPPPLSAGPPGGDPLWETVGRPGLAAKAGAREAPLSAPGLYRVDAVALEAILHRAPLKSGAPAGPELQETLSLPLPDGSFRRFRIEESPIMAPELAARFPEIRTYTLQGIDDPALSGRLSRDPHGVQALILGPDGAIQVNPARRGHPYYRSLWERPEPEELFCQTTEEPRPLSLGPHPGGAPWAPLGGPVPGFAPKANPSGGTLRIYRLAVATTGEYYAGRDAGGGDADVLASVVAVINRVNAVYEAEVAIRFVLVAENDQILFDDPVTDGYSNNQPCTMRNENTPILDATIGSGAYDVGHVFGSSGGGGCAGGSVVCTNANKGNGASGLRTDLDPGQEGFSGYRLVAHEMGHQFGAGHTWSGENGSCTAGQFSADDAYEPLSGSTLMAYSGICGADNVQGGVADDPYFHTRSFDEIVNFSTGGGGSGCALAAATGNSIPVVDAGPDYTIPRGTPFVLTGSAVDADDATLSYAWEQFDATPVRVSPLVDNGDNPLFRSFPPVTGDASRTFPQLQAVLGYVASPGELLPATDRTMTFRLTARDNRAAGGGVDWDDMQVFVEGPPFAIVAPNGGETLHAGCVEDVLWDVGGGDVAAEVDLRLSTDGGFNYTTLEAGTLNDGAESVPVACTPSLQARVRADAVDNVFFDVSDGDFAVQAEAPAIAASAAGGEVDDECTFEVTFEATVTDDCS
ncbi:MAG TPA: zinc-dependent metalloprotease family protein, partial [Thermoanaerobaculia bacterium]